MTIPWARLCHVQYHTDSTPYWMLPILPSFELTCTPLLFPLQRNFRRRLKQTFDLALCDQSLGHRFLPRALGLPLTLDLCMRHY